MQAKMRTLLVESDQEIRYQLKNMLAMHRIFQVVAEVETAEEAIDCIQSIAVDVVFTNTLPADPRRTGDGNHLSLVLAQSHPHVQTVIYSDSRENAYYACAGQCAGFLLTPFDPLAFQALVNHLTYIYDLQRTQREAANRSIMIRTRSGYQLARLQDILFIERRNRKIIIVTEQGEEITSLGFTMGELEQMLEGSGFYRCYQSFIVNLSKISFIRTDNDARNYALQFQGYSGEIMLSRDRYTELVTILRDKYAKLNI